MPLVDLDDPEELRARWSALAAVAHATGFDRRWYADEHGWYHQDETGSDLRLIRLDGERAVLFGFHTQHSRTAGADLLAGSPDWIGQPEVKRRIAAGQLGFVYGAFNGTWARASYPGDPWQPLDDGFAPIANWVTSDDEAARELIEWAAEWADYLGGLDELLPVGVALIRTAASTGISSDSLLDLFDRLGIGPHSPRHPDLRAALIAAEQFGPGSVAHPGDPTAYSAQAGLTTQPAGEPQPYSQAQPEPMDEPDEEPVIVPPGISPFTGQPIDQSIDVYAPIAQTTDPYAPIAHPDPYAPTGQTTDPYAPEPVVPQPPFDHERPFTPEPPFTPDPPFTPEPAPEPEPTPEPAPEPAPRPAEEYGVTGRKARKLRRKQKNEEDGSALARLGLIGPEPAPPEPIPEPPTVGAPVDDGEDYYASLFADAPAAATYVPDVGPDPDQPWEAPRQQADPDQSRQTARQPAEPEQGAWSSDDDTSEFSPFVDTAGTPAVEEAEQTAEVSASDDTGVIEAVRDEPEPEAEPQPVQREWVGGAWINGEWVEDPAAYLASRTTDTTAPTDAPAHTTDAAGGTTDAAARTTEAVAGPTDGPAPTADAPAGTANAARTTDAAPGGSAAQADVDADTQSGGAVSGGALSDGVLPGDAGSSSVQAPEAAAGAPEALATDQFAADLSDEAPTAEIAAVVDEPIEESVDAAADAETAPVDAKTARVEEEPEEEFYLASRSPFAPADDHRTDEPPSVEPLPGETLPSESQAGGSPAGEQYERDFPVVTNGFTSIDPAELQPGERGYELGGEYFHDEILGDADWTADQLGDTSWSEREEAGQPQSAAGVARDDVLGDERFGQEGPLAGAEPMDEATPAEQFVDESPPAGVGPDDEAASAEQSAVEITAQIEAIGDEEQAPAENGFTADSGRTADNWPAAEDGFPAEDDLDEVGGFVGPSPFVMDQRFEAEHEQETPQFAAEQASVAELKAQELVAPPPSSPVAIPGLGLVGADGPRVEPVPGSIEEAMRAEFERPRPRPQESPAFKALHDWCRARTRIVPSGFTIQVQVLDPDAPSYRFDLEPPQVHDPQYGDDRLSELLGDLWLAEARSEQGGWLFARIDAAGRTLRIDRWYDQVPDWWDNPVEPRLDVHGLVRRLNGRGPDWQPSYLEKLYTTAR